MVGFGSLGWGLEVRVPRRKAQYGVGLWLLIYVV